jgi:hypothetical protein
VTMAVGDEADAQPTDRTNAPRQTTDAVPGAPHVSARRLPRNARAETRSRLVAAAPLSHSLRRRSTNEKRDVKF